MVVHIRRDERGLDTITLCGRRGIPATRSRDEFRRSLPLGIAWCLTCTDTFWAAERRRPDK